jgi:hypothetical protein
LKISPPELSNHCGETVSRLIETGDPFDEERREEIDEKTKNKTV